MRSIQEVGKEVLTGQPQHFYIFAGSEYGIKSKYLEMVKNHYSGKYVEVDSLDAVINMMTTKRLIPLQPMLYIVRYDDSFIASVNEKSAATIANMHIVGTVVCLYQDPKHTAKCDKYLSDYTTSFDAVSVAFVKKYLTSDFPSLPNSFIELAMSMKSDYQSAKMICNSMSIVPSNVISALPANVVAHCFGCDSHAGETQLKIGFASRNFAYIITVLDTYSDDIAGAYYAILSTMLELEKALTSTYKLSGDIAQYKNCWTLESVYYMFMHTFSELQNIRTYTSFDAYDSLVYLASLLQFSQIPTLEVMSNGLN